MRKVIDSELCHETLLKNNPPKYAFDETEDFDVWKADLKKAFISISGLDRIEKNACPLNFQIEEEIKKDGYTQIRFTFDSEAGCSVPCYLLVPDTGKEKYPVAIVVQGHAWGGIKNSIGATDESDELYDNAYAQSNGKFAVQAVENGYIALAVEQRGMGESMPIKPKRGWGGLCKFAVGMALMCGRTVIGERVWDVHKAIDCLSYFDKCDLDKIVITGNSGGGTTSFYSACFDERIKISAPSCSFCSYAEYILNIYHCDCNYMPKAYENFEMQDLSGLIAPRPLIAFTGQKDQIFPLEGVKNAFETVKAVYKKAGVEENCRLIETPYGHFWAPEITWKAINEKAKELGWKN